MRKAYSAVILAFFITISSTYAIGVNEESDSKMKYVKQEFKPEGFDNIDTEALLPSEDTFKGGYNKLIPYVLPSPYQENAGSCLFMSHTGVIEVLMNQKLNTNKIDLSERYLMNLAKDKVASEKVKNWRTDTIFRSNAKLKSYLNKDFRYTKGFYKVVNGKRVKANEQEQGATYGIKYNWVVDYKNIKANAVKLPNFQREVIFKDKDENQWNINGAPKNIVSLIKTAIRKRNAPVLVIYNHHGFWHANFILGFNDKASSDGCKFVSTFEESMNKRADEIVEEANQAQTSKEKEKLLRKAAKFRKRGKEVNDAYLANGGCRGKGIFYVRDSIYPQESMPFYDYDLERQGEEKNLNAPIIVREYEWVERLANHAIQIYVP